MFHVFQWNVADYFNQNKDKLLCNNSGDNNKQKGTQSTSGEETTESNVELSVSEITLNDPQELLYPDFPGVTTLAEMSEFDKLWMCLFTKLGQYTYFNMTLYMTLLYFIIPCVSQVNCALILELLLGSQLDKHCSPQFQHTPTC